MVHRYMTRYAFLACVILATLACSLSSPKEDAGSKWTPFNAKDCELSSFPPPDFTLMKVYEVSLYCPYGPGPGLNGNAYLTINYVEVQADAQKTFDSWRKLIEDANTSTWKTVTNAPLKLVTVQVTPDKLEPNPIVDFSAAELYAGHFVVLVKGGVSNTSEADAVNMVEYLFLQAQVTAGAHLK